jgi:hypothetical protein
MRLGVPTASVHQAEKAIDDPMSIEQARATERTTTQIAAPTVAHEEWLQPFESTFEARRLRRLAGDAELVERAMWAQFVGPDWNRIAERLVAYGLRVLSAWISSSQIYDRCAERNLGVARVRWNSEESHELARDTVAVALRHFRDDVLAKGKWHPSGGAALSTFFIGQCLLRYPNVHRRRMVERRRERDARRALQQDGRVPEVIDIRERTPEQRLMSLESTRIEVAHIEPWTKSVAVYRSMGYPWAEVSELTGLSIAAAKSRLTRVEARSGGLDED